jgi:hypothetical protein
MSAGRAHGVVCTVSWVRLSNITSLKFKLAFDNAEAWGGTRLFHVSYLLIN